MAKRLEEIYLSPDIQEWRYERMWELSYYCSDISCGRVRVKLASEKAGLYLNVGQTKVMMTEDQGEMVVDGKHIEVVSNFIFLGSLITKDGLCEKEIRRRLAMGRSAMGGLTKIWKDRGITLRTKIRLVKALVFPVVLYVAESWTMRKLERKMILSYGVGDVCRE